MTVSDNERVTKAAGVVGAATFLSRIFGFIRDVVIAWAFGAGLSADAFFVAFRIPNLLRRLFAEGSLSIAFIPVFTQYLAQRGKEEAFNMARSALWITSFLLAAVTVAGVLLSPLIIHLIAPGFAGASEKFSLTVKLTQLLFPYIFFIGLVALCMGILNVLGHFAAPALAPVFLNLSMIASVVFLSPRMQDPVWGLAVGVLIGGILQLALQLPFLIKNGFRFWARSPIYHEGLKTVGRLMVPTIFGSAVYQINILVGTLLASLLPEGSVSYLYYADRLVQFPLGIFAVATATAVLPNLSRQVAEKDIKGAKETFAHAVRLVLFITVPSMIGLIVLRTPIVDLLFRRGAFDAETTRLTAIALLYYGMGLWAFSTVRVVVSVFYALQDTKTPAKTAVVSIAANVILGIVLMGPLNHGGLALATSLASMINLGLLVRTLRTRLGGMGWKGILTSGGKTTAGSMIMGAVVWGVSRMIIPCGDDAGSGLFTGLMGSIGAGIICFVVFSLLTKAPELDRIAAVVKKNMRIGKGS
jgi:putative peptidoglycan lipid II flippase